MGGKLHIPTAVRFGVVETLLCGCVSDSLRSGSVISEAEKLNSVSSQGQDRYGKKKQMPPESRHLLNDQSSRSLFVSSVSNFTKSDGA